jgi:hypothetical protein
MATNGRVDQESSRIPVAYLILGWENNRKAVRDFYRNARTIVNMITDEITPTIGSKIEWVNRERIDVRRRGVKSRQIIDITQNNLPDCKKIMSMVDEVRHLSGVKVVFGVSDIEFIAMVPSLAPMEEVKKIQFVYSDSESVVGYKRLVFDALWTRAVSAQSRIDELEGLKEDVAGEKDVAVGTTNKIIDRIYVCKDCYQTFIYIDELNDHRDVRGHGNFNEYPVV